ncbi:MAG: molybdopterin-dependent oxidoreductase [Ignavibacteriaceae bacterium]|jgi:NADH-quinone oxidoreductase subunit G
MPKIIIDGKDIEFKAGQTVIQAARENGIEIPHFCWHPSLSVSGNCRVCLVEIEKMPKLVISCATQAMDGMVVQTQSEKVVAARNAVMEFILINHPLDCPICDEAGECKLQDYAYQHSVGESRFTEEKNHKEKRVELGPNVMFDGERCISCSRCIRFCDEIAGKKELTFIKRGDRVTITTFPGKKLENPYSMNVTDICPVGALTNRDFRFKSRVWEMAPTKTICSGCARGCNIDLWTRNNEVLRLTPRQNDEVNSFWMCDNGRLNTFKHINANDRVNGPHIRKEGKFTKVGWDEAYAKTLSELKSYAKDEIAALASSSLTVEDAYLVSKFVRAINVKNFDFVPKVIAGSGDDILIREDKSANANGVKLMNVDSSKGGLKFDEIISHIESGRIKALILIEEDLINLDSAFEKALAKLDFLVTFSTNFDATTSLAKVVFPASTYAEKNGTWINFQGRIQRIRPAVTTIEMERSLDGMSQSRWDKFGTDFDSWGKAKKNDARPTWKIISGLANAFGTKYKFTMAEEIFNEIAHTNPLFTGLDYDVIGESGVQLKTETGKPARGGSGRSQKLSEKI